MFPRVILIGKRVVAIARSWSLDDLAAGMDGDNETGEVSSGLARIGGFFLFFSFARFKQTCTIRQRYM